jgi:putative flippase GtrA
MKRWLKFNAVGFGGIPLQLAAIALLARYLHYMPATAIGVEAAIVHNYFWHERFTWRDRQSRSRLVRFLKFNLTTGGFSILGNVGLMALFVGKFRFPYLLSNLLAIATCSIANFLVSDRLVFQKAALGFTKNNSSFGNPG